MIFLSYYFKKQGTKSPEKKIHTLRIGKSPNQPEADLLLKRNKNSWQWGFSSLFIYHLEHCLYCSDAEGWQAITSKGTLQLTLRAIYSLWVSRKRFPYEVLSLSVTHKRTGTKGIIRIHTTLSLKISVDKAKWIDTALLHIPIPLMFGQVGKRWFC